MKIKFVPINIEVDVDPNKSLLQIAGDNNVHIRSICKGVPSCAECRVKIVEGDNNVIPPGKAELNLIGSSYHIDSRRLSCQMRCFGPVTVDVSDHLDRNEAPSKKIRGFKSQKPHESHAVQDTLILSEPEAPIAANQNQPQQNHQQRPQNQNSRQGQNNGQQQRGPNNRNGQGNNGGNSRGPNRGR